MTLSLSRSVALLQSLSSRILVTRGNRTDMPPAVWAVDLLNSAPVISHTGAVCGTRSQRMGEWSCVYTSQCFPHD